MALSSINLFNNNFHNKEEQGRSVQAECPLFLQNRCYNPFSSHTYEMKGGSFYGEKVAPADEKMDYR
jgi:hypothetical protein